MLGVRRCMVRAGSVICVERSSARRVAGRVLEVWRRAGHCPPLLGIDRCARRAPPSHMNGPRLTCSHNTQHFTRLSLIFLLSMLKDLRVMIHDTVRQSISFLYAWISLQFSGYCRAGCTCTKCSISSSSLATVHICHRCRSEGGVLDLICRLSPAACRLL